MVWQAVMIITILIVIIALLCLKIVLLKKSAKEINKGFKNGIENDTNSLIGVSSRDKDISSLCRELNDELIRLRALKLKYEQGDKELKTAITNISHDIRTPLTAINGYLKLLEKESMSAEAEEYISIIKERTLALKKLSEELFEYSVTTSKAQEQGRAEEVYVNRILEESISAMYASLCDKGISPEIDITNEKVIRQSDKEALSRVFSNTLSNVLKYSDGDLYIKMDSNGLISFTNTASQLTEVDTERLFDRFYTVNNARTSTGLGLSIAKTLAGKAGAEISARLEGDKLTIYVNI